MTRPLPIFWSSYWLLLFFLSIFSQITKHLFLSLKFLEFKTNPPPPGVWMSYYQYNLKLLSKANNLLMNGPNCATVELSIACMECVNFEASLPTSTCFLKHALPLRWYYFIRVVKRVRLLGSHLHPAFESWSTSDNDLYLIFYFKWVHCRASIFI